MRFGRPIFAAATFHAAAFAVYITLGEYMDIPAPAYATIGAISAATIAGGISFLIAVLSKDQKTSEFRQAWIDGLRNEVAELISLFLVITDTIRVMDREGKTLEQIGEHLSQKDEHFCKWEMSDAKIKLRLNPREHHKLLAALLVLRKFPKSGKLLDSGAADAVVEEVIKESQTVLKCEWKRVKRGEPVFVATKAISLTVIVGAVLLWVGYAQNHLHIELIP